MSKKQPNSTEKFDLVMMTSPAAVERRDGALQVSRGPPRYQSLMRNEVLSNQQYSRPKNTEDDDLENYEPMNLAAETQAPVAMMQAPAVVPGYEYKEFSDTNLYQTIRDTSFVSSEQQSTGFYPGQPGSGTNRGEILRRPALPAPQPSFGTDLGETPAFNAKTRPSTSSLWKGNCGKVVCTVLVFALLFLSLGALSLALRNYLKNQTSEVNTSEQLQFGSNEVGMLSDRMKSLEKIVAQMQTELDRHQDAPSNFLSLHEKLNSTVTATESLASSTRSRFAALEVSLTATNESLIQLQNTTHTGLSALDKIVTAVNNSLTAAVSQIQTATNSKLVALDSKLNDTNISFATEVSRLISKIQIFNASITQINSTMLALDLLNLQSSSESRFAAFEAKLSAINDSMSDFQQAVNANFTVSSLSLTSRISDLQFAFQSQFSAAEARLTLANRTLMSQISDLESAIQTQFLRLESMTNDSSKSASQLQIDLEVGLLTINTSLSSQISQLRSMSSSEFARYDSRHRNAEDFLQSLAQNQIELDARLNKTKLSFGIWLSALERDNNMTVQNISTLASNISHLQLAHADSMTDTNFLATQLNGTLIDIGSLSLQVSHLESTLRIITNTDDIMLLEAKLNTTLSAVEGFTTLVSNLQSQHTEVKSNLSTLSHEINSIGIAISSLAEQMVALQEMSEMKFNSLQGTLNVTTMNISDLVGQISHFELIKTRLTAIASSLDNRINGTVNTIDTLASRFSVFRSATQSDVADLDRKVNASGISVQILKSELSLFQSLFNVSQQELSSVTSLLNLTTAKTDSLSARVVFLDASIQTLNSSLSDMGNLYSQVLLRQTGIESDTQSLILQVNYTISTVDILASQVSALQLLKISTQSLLASLESRANSTDNHISVIVSQMQVMARSDADDFNSRLNMTINSLNIQITSLNTRLTDTIGTVNELAPQVSSLQATFHLESTILGQRINTTLASLGMLTTQLASLQHETRSKDISFDVRLNSTAAALDTLTLQVTSLRDETRSQDASLNAHVNAVVNSVHVLRSQIQSLLAESRSKDTSLDTQLNSTIAIVSALSSRAMSLQTQITSANNHITQTRTTVTALSSGQSTLTRNLHTATTDINSINSRLSTTSNTLSRLTSAVSTPVSLYSGCLKHMETCTVSLHSTNLYWYRCNTAYVGISVSTRYVLSSHCQHDPDAHYVDTTSLEVMTQSSDTFVRCHCNVVGLTSTGVHGDIFNPIPHGTCTLVVTHCPLTRTLFST